MHSLREGLDPQELLHAQCMKECQAHGCSRDSNDLHIQGSCLHARTLTQQAWFPLWSVHLHTKSSGSYHTWEIPQSIFRRNPDDYVTPS